MTENPESHKFETGKLKLKITLAADRNAVDPVVQSVMELVREVHWTRRSTTPSNWP